MLQDITRLEGVRDHEGNVPLPVVIEVKPGVGVLPALNEREQNQLQDCEQILEKGLTTFFEVGIALLNIRESRLYRGTHRTFEQYCRERWGIGRAYACRVIGAAERIKLLKDDSELPKPENEFQIRPFLKLAPEAFPEAWKRAARSAKQGKITRSIVEEVLQDLLPDKRAQRQKEKKGRRRRTSLPMGQVLALLHDAKKKVRKGETEFALDVLQRIEVLLYGG